MIRNQMLARKLTKALQVKGIDVELEIAPQPALSDHLVEIPGKLSIQVASMAICPYATLYTYSEKGGEIKFIETIEFGDNEEVTMKELVKKVLETIEMRA